MGQPQRQEQYDEQALAFGQPLDGSVLRLEDLVDDPIRFELADLATPNH